MWKALLIAPVLGCSSRGPVPTPPDAETPSSDDLRPPIEDRSPNANGQVPAFEGQTRAPQPAGPSRFSIETVAEGLTIPWSVEFLGDGRLIVSERPGRLRIVEANGSLGEPLSGVPEVAARGQGGLLDIGLPPDFASSRLVFLTYSEPRDGRENGTSVVRGRLSDDRTALENVTVIFRMQPGRDSGHHFGSRIVFTDDGNLFVTLGDRGGSMQMAQDPTNHLGSVLRLRPDGSVPDDNPFVDHAQNRPEIWSYGHRNLQAATLDGQGRLWTVEHGPQGGDELNQPQPGVNHGWPIITYGENYNGQPIGDGITAQEGLQQPIYYWDPVIAPSGMDYYDGELFPQWQGDLLVGGLRAEAVVRLTLKDDRVYTEEWLDVDARARDVKVGPDGAIYVATDDGTILRLVPSA